MKSHLVSGLFALYVVAVSLARFLRDEEFFRLTAMKRLWGRTRGLVFHFLANVALPMVLGIIFLSQAAVHDGPLSANGHWDGHFYGAQKDGLGFSPGQPDAKGRTENVASAHASGITLAP